MTSAAEGGRKILAFFLVKNQDFGGKITNFGAFQNPTDISNFDGRKFWRKWNFHGRESSGLSADIFFGQNREEGIKKKQKKNDA